MLALIAFVLGLLVGGWAVAHRMRGSLSWSEVVQILSGKRPPIQTNGGGGGPSEPL